MHHYAIFDKGTSAEWESIKLILGWICPQTRQFAIQLADPKKVLSANTRWTRGQDIARHAGPTIRELPPGDRARVCAELAFRYMKASVSGDSRSLAEVTDEFEKGACDPAWLTTIDEYLQYFGIGGQRQSIPYLRPADVGARTIEIKSDARVALVGDWGTGARPCR